MDEILALLGSADAWASLLTLTALEIVLGIDNIIFLTILVGRLPEHQRQRGRVLQQHPGRPRWAVSPPAIAGRV